MLYVSQLNLQVLYFIDYPYNIKDNSASHQYDIDDPESSRNAREKSFPEISQTKLKNDNVDYGMWP